MTWSISCRQLSWEILKLLEIAFKTDAEEIIAEIFCIARSDLLIELSSPRKKWMCHDLRQILSHVEILPLVESSISPVVAQTLAVGACDCRRRLASISCFLVLTFFLVFTALQILFVPLLKQACHFSRHSLGRSCCGNGRLRYTSPACQGGSP